MYFILYQVLLFYWISSYYTAVPCVSKSHSWVELIRNWFLGIGIELELTFLKTKGIGIDSGIDKKELEWNLELIKRNWPQLWWEAQSADDPQLFIRTLKQRMIEESDNNWLINLNGSNRYFVYKLYKQFRYKVNYLNVISSGISRRVTSRFRMGVIVRHKLRFIQDSDTVHVCPICME